MTIFLAVSNTECVTDLKSYGEKNLQLSEVFTCDDSQKSPADNFRQNCSIRVR